MSHIIFNKGLTMITRHYTFDEHDFPIDAQQIISIIEHYPKIKNGVFFDIETTGFSADKNALYLIGCCWYENQQWKLVQWLATDKSEKEQSLILQHFFDCIKQFKTLISYNGNTFDLPFISKKCAILNLEFDICSWEHIDLYVAFRPLKNILQLENLKLKSIERFLGIYREDIYSGGALIPIYETYTKSSSEELLQLLLLHNYEDIKDMLFVLPLYTYIHSLSSEFIVKSTKTLKDTNIFQIHIEVPIAFAKPITYEHKLLICNDSNIPQLSIGIHMEHTIVTLDIPIFTGTLKHFYNNPKDYYYLPMEDYAIHKSIAEFVDKCSKKKATAQTCYIKKEGTYIPQKTGIYTPSFKFNYKDSIEWIVFDEKIIHEKDFNTYVKSLLQIIFIGCID